MNENPYQTPEADLEPQAGENSVQFYVVSISKFTILFFSTMSLYVLYWFYRNWREYKNHTGGSLWPVPRAIFNIFFTHSLFKAVNNSLTDRGQSFDWAPATLASAYVFVAIASNILDKMSTKGIGLPYTEVLSLLMLPLMYFALVKAQKAINISQNDAEGVSNNQLAVWNYLWIVLGLLLWAMMVLGWLAMLGLIEL